MTHKKPITMSTATLLFSVPDDSVDVSVVVSVVCSVVVVSLLLFVSTDVAFTEVVSSLLLSVVEGIIFVVGSSVMIVSSSIGGELVVVRVSSSIFLVL